MISMPSGLTASPPGTGIVHLGHGTNRFTAMKYVYPLKLISPEPLGSDFGLVHTLFILSYGGGLVAGDSVDLKISLDSGTSLVILTQGSTKIFKSPIPHCTTTQCLTVSVDEGASLCYIPDPVQPFQSSLFKQRQIYRLSSTNTNICVCDWVCCGRAAHGEHWDFVNFSSTTEIWDMSKETRGRLLLRDNLGLDNNGEWSDGTISSRLDPFGAYGSLVLMGESFSSLGKFFIDEFKEMPRVGAKSWVDLENSPCDSKEDSLATRRTRRQGFGDRDGLIWTATQVRGGFVIKFGAREIEGVKRFLRSVLIDEGTIERRFGSRALLCLQ